MIRHDGASLLGHEATGAASRYRQSLSEELRTKGRGGPGLEHCFGNQIMGCGRMCLQILNNMSVCTLASDSAILIVLTDRVVKLLCCHDYGLHVKLAEISSSTAIRTAGTG
jgi:hypothetical protein